ncbi:MAG: ASKHA domain-containing protein [Candidatus Korarchaeum sp.]
MAPKVFVLPLNRELTARRGDILGELLSRELGFELPCGGAGFCGNCIIRMVKGALSEPSPEERISGVLERGMRLACRTRIEGDVVIEIPEIRPVAVFSGVMPRLRPDPTPKYFRRGECSSEVGFAVDLGTTKIAGAIVDLDTGETLAEGFVVNPQVSRGADLITRVERSLRGEGEELRRLAVKGITELLSKIAKDRCLSSILIVGNSVMQSLLLGLDVESLARAPFDPPLKGWLIGPAPELGLPDALAIIPPSLGGFAGSDALADIITARLLRIEAPYLLLDLGTNAEVILDTGSSILVATAPAGSAFETSVPPGIAGVEEAIREVRLEGGEWRLRFSGRPWGLSGSGLISAVAEMLRNGLIDENGRMRRDLNGRVTLLEDPRVEITQRDIREVQKGVASIYAAWRTLVEEARVRPERVVMAGTFGTFVRFEDALDIGLIPPVNESSFISIGNSALAGAKSMLISKEAFDLANSLLAEIVHIELTGNHHFPDIFVEGLSLRRRA